MKGGETVKGTKAKRALCLLLCAVLIGIFIKENTNVRAAIGNEEEGVSVSDATIENSTLVVGSYLIHINGMSDEVYDLAQESANTFNQHKMYYKSELANGQWFEISTATSIADITSEGTPVDKSVIEAIKFTHKTDSNGVTTDLRTGTSVCIYDTPDPYDLESMEELEPLKNQYQMLQEKVKKTDSDEIYITIISRFYAKSIRDSETNEWDRAISGLNVYRQGLTERGKPATWTQAVDKVMEGVDANRRVKSLTTLSGYLDDLLERASAEQETSEDKDGYEMDSDFIMNSDVIQAIGDSKQNVENSIMKYTAKQLVEGTTATNQSRYRYSNELIDSAKISDVNGCDSATEKLVNLENILSGKIVNIQSELDELQSGLVDDAYNKYLEKLSAGVSDEYKQAQAEGAAQSVKDGYLKAQKDETNAARLEYQTLLDEQLKRMSSADAQSSISTRMDEIDNLRSLVPDDAASAYQLETLDSYLGDLRDTLTETIRNDSDDTEMEALKKQKEDLERQKQDALDKNNLKEAKRLDAELEAKQKDMDDLQKKMLDTLNSSNSSESDKAKALAGLGDSNAASMLNSLAGKIASGIRNQENDDFANNMAAFLAASQLDPDAAKGALDDIKDAMDNASSLDGEMASEMASAISDMEQQINDALDKEGLSADQLKDLLGAFLGDGSGNSDASDQASALVALSRYGKEYKNADAKALAASYAKKFAAEGNPYIYRKYDGDVGAYMSLQAVANTLGYRYIFDDAHYTVTLSKSKDYYEFTNGKTVYEMAGGKEQQLLKEAGFMSTIYIASEDSETIFKAKAEYIDDTDYAVLVTDSMESKISEMIEILKKGA